MKKFIIFGLSAMLLVLAGCQKDFLDTKPTDQLSADVIFETYDGAITALDGTYRLMYDWKSNHNEFNQKAVDMTFDLKGEDMVIYSQGYGWFLDQYGFLDRDATQRYPAFIWDYLYDLVNNSNRILANLGDIEASEQQYNYLKGQAHAIRAYAYFNLIRHFQHTYKGHENDPGVPLYTEPTTEGKPRATVEAVYTLIEDDLGTAIDLLGNTFERIHISHINQSVAQGLMARVKLTKEEWGQAASYAVAAREGYTLYQPEEYTPNGFNQISGEEWMWGMQINSEHSTIYASFFSHMDATFFTYAFLGLQKLIYEPLYNRIPDTDVRKDMFLAEQQGPTLPKYNQMKFLSYDPSGFLGDYLFMRTSEMYLIEAEALANNGDDAGARTILEELIVNRDPEFSTDAAGQDLLEEIYFQRRVELWGEGFRFYDIKRRKQALDRTGGNHDPSLARVMQMEAEDYRMIYQIPEDELTDNDALDNQNP